MIALVLRVAALLAGVSAILPLYQHRGARAAAPDCPHCAPVPVPGTFPWFAATRDALDQPAFTTAASARFKNRPLYGPHNGALVLAGDRPITHLADDGAIYGGLLLGLRQGGTFLWAHDFDTLQSSFSAGAVRWAASDSRLPGLELRAAVLPSAQGVGFVLDANVSDSSGGSSGAELVWAWGCAAASSAAVGWAKDPLVNPATLQWDFTPGDCKGNTVSLGADNATVTTRFAGSRSVGLALATSAPSRSLLVQDAAGWRNFSAAPPPTPPARASAALPLPGATLWLRASSLALANGSAVPAWADESGQGAAFAQATPALQPTFLAQALGERPGVAFDGLATYLASATPSVGAESTMLAVLRDEGSLTDCCSGVVCFLGSLTGISTLTAHGGAHDVDDDDGGHVAAGPPIVTTLDYPGSAAYGHANIRGRAVVAGSVFAASAPSFSLVDGCVQATASVAGTPSAGGALLGKRGFDEPRYFKGVLGEVVVFPRALNASELALMHEYFYAAWPAVIPKRACEPPAGPLAVGRSPLGAATTRFTWAAQASAAPPADALAALAAAGARTQALASRASSRTPDPLIDAALPALSLAVDGLYRDNPGAFVHGAMAWDSLYLGWRSEVGATVLGSPELVAHEGAYFFSHQIQESPNAVCHSSATNRYTSEDSDSRFHGKGRIDVNGGICE